MAVRCISMCISLHCSMICFSFFQYNLRTVFAAEVMKITLRSDKDGDMKIDLKEGYTLALRLKIHLNTYGINLDSEMFYSMLEQDNSIENIVKFCAEGKPVGYNIIKE